jgi:hypothetical protein
MIGHLYRYPHPHDPARFIYVGQGAKRDYRHRPGNSSFGRRFKRDFPNTELPRPVRELVEVQDQQALNELETIWMFQFHTWYGYDGGMNLQIPGAEDYKNLGKISLERGTGIFSLTPEHRKQIGKKLKADKRGIFSLTPERRSEIGRSGGLIGGRAGRGVSGDRGQWGTHEQRVEAAKAASLIGVHKQRHVLRNKINPSCALCSEQNLIIAYA